MKVLGISGSPRRDGNTDLFLDKALEGAKNKGAEVEKISLQQFNIKPCGESEYEAVDDQGLSVVGDDMRIIFEKVKTTDAIIIASPVFFGSISAQTKMMIDRFQCVWISKNIYKKEIFTKKLYGGFICAAASDRKDFFDNSKAIVRHFFATINVEPVGEIYCTGVDWKGDALKHPEHIEKAFKLGEKIVSKFGGKK
jgi:multimeric flavodoxin WrbA